MREIELTWGANRDLMTALAADSARVLVIGGTAVRFHAPERREPNDLDLLVEPTVETASKLIRAVETVIGRPLGIQPAQLARPAVGFREKAVLNVDVVTPYAGFDFAQAWADAEEATIVCSTTVVRVASTPTLLVWLRHALTAEPTRAESIASDIALLTERPVGRRWGQPRVKGPATRRCPTCRGDGLEPGRHSERDTSGGRDEVPPCPTCFGSGEVEPDLEATDEALGSSGASTPRFTYGDTIRVKTDVAHPRAGQEAEVVAITQVESDVLAAHYRVAIGTTVYTVEFSDGSSAEFPADALDAAA